MFRHSSKARRDSETPKDYKAEVFKLLNNPKKNFLTEGSMENAKDMVQFLIKYGVIADGKTYKTIYDALIGGDPRQRTLRALFTNINMRYSKANDGSKKNGKRSHGSPVHAPVGGQGQTKAK
jgi:hypothetical protein